MKKTTRNFLLWLALVGLSIGSALCGFAGWADNRYYDLLRNYKTQKELAHERMRIRIQNVIDEHRAAYRDAGFSDDQISLHMKHDYLLQSEPGCSICQKRDEILENYRLKSAKTETAKKTITTEELFGQRTKPLKKPYNWSYIPASVGGICLAYSVIFPVSIAVFPLLKSLLPKIGPFLASRKGRILLVVTFAPSVLIFLIYLLNGGNWPDDEVVGWSFVVGPLVVWGIIGLYHFIQSGEKEGQN